jgi:phosphoglycolate phosphatase
MPNALFDLDGTLCDPREGILRGFRHAFAVLGLPFPGEAAITPLIGQPLLRCFQTLGVDGRSEEAARHFQAFFEERGFAEGRLYDGVLPLLRRLRAEGWGLAVASAKPGFAVAFVVESLGIRRFFDGLHGCAAGELLPVKASIVAAALRAHAWKAADTVLIGDRDQDRDAARANGLRFIGATWGFGALQELEGAHAVAADPPALERLLLDSA